ncbi:HNH endonuclease [Acidithiobacillus ferrooxidans]|uniref:RNA-guided endonuclease IscB n=1 Tax=Acidithiobacillus ferrooxidans TaxID=920 RepID=UPI001C064C69|nr:RNA-guided endonuclease IscB [Acidithiobacillus ferrooxidans]MBU2774209.1 HNH endonuclease [Acidithiobacillus ferrooxidans]
MQNRVFVLDAQRAPLMPCHPARARALLRQRKAAVFRRFPFTIILNERNGGGTQNLTIRSDPGSKTTGLALVAAFRRGLTVIWAGELAHRGHIIHVALERRSDQRHSRRSRKTRHRAPRFDHRTRPAGWLPPSILHRVVTVVTWHKRLMRWAPITDASMERVRFDMQAMQNPGISGTEYQQGTLFGYEVREYLLEKWMRTCTYCDAQGVPLEIDHVHPRSLGGSDRVSNLAIACHDCNQAKGNQPLAIFLQKDAGRRERQKRFAAAYADNVPKKREEREQHEANRLERVLKQVKAPLRDAAAVNATRNILFERLLDLGLPIETGSGGRTKFNRSLQHYPKAHWIDAACVGKTGECVRLDPMMRPLQITAAGHGRRQMQNMTKKGFPRGKAKSRQKIYFGLQTGDMVRAVVTDGKHVGTYVGRVLCRKSGSFDIKTESDRIGGVPHRYCHPIHRSDGYRYVH